VHALALADMAGGAGQVQIAPIGVAQQVLGVPPALAEGAGATGSVQAAVTLARGTLQLPRVRVVAAVPREHTGRAYYHIHLDVGQARRGKVCPDLECKAPGAGQESAGEKSVARWLCVYDVSVHLSASKSKQANQTEKNNNTERSGMR